MTNAQKFAFLNMLKQRNASVIFTNEFNDKHDFVEVAHVVLENCDVVFFVEYASQLTLCDVRTLLIGMNACVKSGPQKMNSEDPNFDKGMEVSVEYELDTKCFLISHLKKGNPAPIATIAFDPAGQEIVFGIPVPLLPCERADLEPFTDQRLQNPPDAGKIN